MARVVNRSWWISKCVNEGSGHKYLLCHRYGIDSTARECVSRFIDFSLRSSPVSLYDINSENRSILSSLLSLSQIEVGYDTVTAGHVIAAEVNEKELAFLL